MKLAVHIHGIGLAKVLAFLVFFCALLPVHGFADDSASERAFFEMLRTQAKTELTEVEKQIPAEKRGAFRRVWHKVYDSFQEYFDFKSFVLRQGKVATSFYPIAWINDHLLIAALLAIGEPSLAFGYYTSPGTVTQTAGAMAVSEGIDTYRLMRDLELRSKPWEFWKLSKERKRILGGANRNNLLATVMDAGRDEAEKALPVQVVRKIRSGMALHPETYIARTELETLIAKSPGGLEMLEEVRPLKSEAQLHTMMLLEFIRARPALADELLAKVAAERARKAALPAGNAAADEARRRLLVVSAARQRTEYLQDTLSRERNRLQVDFASRAHRLAEQFLLQREDFAHPPGSVVPGITELLPQHAPIEATRLEFERDFLHRAIQRAEDRLEDIQRQLVRTEHGILYESMTGKAPPEKLFRGEAAWDPDTRVAGLRAELEKSLEFVQKARTIPARYGFSDAVEELLGLERALFPEVTAAMQSSSGTQRFAEGARRFATGCLALFQRAAIWRR